MTQTRNRIPDSELALYENLIAFALASIFDTQKIAVLSDDPDVVELAVKLNQEAHEQRKLVIDWMERRKNGHNAN